MDRVHLFVILWQHYFQTCLVSKITSWAKLFFFYHGFLSRTLTNRKTAGEGRGPSFIPLYYFYPLTNIQTFTLQLCTWDEYHVYLIALIYLPGCYSVRFTTLSNYYLIDWWCNVDFCLFACWFDFRFRYSYLTWETGGLELASTIILVLQANRLTKSKCASLSSLKIMGICKEADL